MLPEGRKSSSPRAQAVPGDSFTLSDLSRPGAYSHFAERSSKKANNDARSEAMRRDKCSDEGQASESTALENLSSVSM